MYIAILNKVGDRNKPQLQTHFGNLESIYNRMKTGFLKICWLSRGDIYSRSEDGVVLGTDPSGLPRE